MLRNTSDLLTCVYLCSVFTMRMYLALFTLCLGAVFAAPSFDKQLDEHWEQWRSWHGKKYHEVRAR